MRQQAGNTANSRSAGNQRAWSVGVESPVSGVSNRRRAGFTLLELIAAVAITTLITGAAVLIFSNMTAAQRRIERQAERQQQARAALHAVTEALRNVHLPADNDSILFEGIDDVAGPLPNDRLRLLTVSRRTIRPGEPESDVHEVEFFIDTSGASAGGADADAAADRPPVLVRRVDPTRNAPPDGGGVMERVAEHVIGLEIQYYAGGEWTRDWPASRRGVPTAVNVQVMVAPPEDGALREPWVVSRLVHFPRRGRASFGGGQGGGS